MNDEPLTPIEQRHADLIALAHRLVTEAELALTSASLRTIEGLCSDVRDIARSLRPAMPA